MIEKDFEKHIDRNAKEKVEIESPSAKGGFSVIDRRLIAQSDLESLEEVDAASLEEVRKPKYVQELEKKVVEKEEKLLNYIKAHKSSEKAMEEYKERLRRDREQFIDREMAKLVGGLLEVMDDLERTRESAKYGTEVQAVAEGIELVQKKFISLLKTFNVEPIESLGKPFDPNFCEAIAMTPVGDKSQDGAVVSEYSTGWKLKEIVIRPGRVAVGKYDGDKAQEANNTQDG